jgi:hypothetical protein
MKYVVVDLHNAYQTLYAEKNMELNLVQLFSEHQEAYWFCLPRFTKKRFSEISNSFSEIFRMTSVQLVHFVYGHKTITVTFIIQQRLILSETSENHHYSPHNSMPSSLRIGLSGDYVYLMGH